MTNYLTITDAVTDLHKRGFSEDFVWLGHAGLFWIQGQSLISPTNFRVLESHEVAIDKHFKSSSRVRGFLVITSGLMGISIERITSSGCEDLFKESCN